MFARQKNPDFLGLADDAGAHHATSSPGWQYNSDAEDWGSAAIVVIGKGVVLVTAILTTLALVFARS